ncbi:MAG: alkaline phosphatase family protein [Acidimicrobiales bacterium]
MKRRTFLRMAAGAAGATGAFIAGCSSPSAGRASSTSSTTRSTTPGHVGLPPKPSAPIGSDQLPQFDHLVVVMMENHSFDNAIGLLGRGDGFTLGPDGRPTATNPDGHGGLVHAFPMPTPCQLANQPTQTWNASHQQYDHGTNEGFVLSASGPVAMGYFTVEDLPFTYGLARTFPIADRWFCSVLAQTFPNRRYLLAGTSLGLIDDSLLMTLPPNGTILEQLERHDISWRDYSSNLPGIGVWPGLLAQPAISRGIVGIESFYRDCAAGTLPSCSFVDPNFNSTSEENPQDVQFGDGFLAKVVNAVMSGPKWSKTLLLWTYDEHGGYYDHVVPPPAPAPDRVPPLLAAGDVAGSFDRFGFRVPSGVVSPYAKKDYVSHRVYDHTSILKLIETKWNLPALTIRDASANSPLDMVDFEAPAAFARPPRLPAPANPARQDSCEVSGAGTIPPPGAVTGP